MVKDFDNQKTIVTTIPEPTKLYIFDPQKRGFIFTEIDMDSGNIKINKKCHSVSRVNGEQKHTKPGAKPEHWVDLLLYNKERKLLYRIEKIKEIFIPMERFA